MRFQLPEITFPLSIDTIGKLLATGQEILAHCCTFGCTRKDGRVNLVLIGRKSPFGLGQGSQHRELLRYVFCPVCREAGRDDKNLTFTFTAPEPNCKWPKADHDRSEAAKRARGGEAEL